MDGTQGRASPSPGGTVSGDLVPVSASASGGRAEFDQPAMALTVRWGVWAYRPWGLDDHLSRCGGTGAYQATYGHIHNEKCCVLVRVLLADHEWSRAGTLPGSDTDAGGTMGPGPTRRRYCRCGTHLATDNTAGQCARCERASRDKLLGPPEVPAEFWQTEQFEQAFAAQHIGRIARAYRTHPYHHAVYGPGGISQTLLGGASGRASANSTNLGRGCITVYVTPVAGVGEPRGVRSGRYCHAHG
jgi:hypothetical protein